MSSTTQSQSQKTTFQSEEILFLFISTPFKRTNTARRLCNEAEAAFVALRWYVSFVPNRSNLLPTTKEELHHHPDDDVSLIQRG